MGLQILVAIQIIAALNFLLTHHVVAQQDGTIIKRNSYHFPAYEQL